MLYELSHCIIMSIIIGPHYTITGALALERTCACVTVGKPQETIIGVDSISVYRIPWSFDSKLANRREFAVMLCLQHSLSPSGCCVTFSLSV